MSVVFVFVTINTTKPTERKSVAGTKFLRRTCVFVLSHMNELLCVCFSVDFRCGFICFNRSCYSHANMLSVCLSKQKRVSVSPDCRHTDAGRHSVFSLIQSGVPVSRDDNAN